ncbi:MAG: PEP-CTERM sorting domain-containing protein [Planctomycetota bacterium]|jgi:hypothetical protein
MFSLTRWGVVLVALAATATMALGSDPPLTLSGSLSVGGGGADGTLTAMGAWDDSSTTLSWVVDNVTVMDKWHYKYTLTVPVGGISHIIIQASGPCPGPAFELSNLFNLTSDPMGCIDDVEIKVHTPAEGNPSMPGDLYGIKFETSEMCDPLTLMIEFDSDRGPRWGDFYSKNGVAGSEGLNEVYNSSFGGFIPDDTLVQSGSYMNHLLVPDTGNLIPEPTAMALLALGGAAWTVKRKRR